MIGKDELERALRESLTEAESGFELDMQMAFLQEQGIDAEAFNEFMSETVNKMEPSPDSRYLFIHAFATGFRAAQVAAAEEQVVLDRAIEASAVAAANEVRVVDRKLKLEQQVDEETVEEFAGSVYLRAINAARDEARKLGRR